MVDPLVLGMGIPDFIVLSWRFDSIMKGKPEQTKVALVFLIEGVCRRCVGAQILWIIHFDKHLDFIYNLGALSQMTRVEEYTYVYCSECDTHPTESFGLEQMSIDSVKFPPSASSSTIHIS